MTKQEQIAFVLELSRSIAELIVEKIEEGKVPDNWDGVEFRWLLSLYHKTESWMGSRGRKRKFNNTVIVNNL